MTAASNFWPWGSGLGSFEAVFPTFQPSLNFGQNSYIEHAHNDYAQLVMELGLVGVLLMFGFAVLILNQIYQFIGVFKRDGALSKNLIMQCFCGVSLVAFLLHCWVEFNMHIPALAMTAAFLSGVFLRTTSLDKTP
jgi:O-antigen ligase